MIWFSRKRGFTLIELLVVISIISLLSSVVLSSLNGARAKARDARRYADIRNLNNAIQLYILNNNKAPDFQGTCDPAISGDLSCEADTVGQIGNWDLLKLDLAPYIKSLPTDPCGATCFGKKGENEFYTYQYYSAAQMVDACGGGITCDGGPTASTRYYIFAETLETKSGPYGFRVGYASL